ncbi:MAG: hypothetical protein AAGE80_17560 [Pseudomonadota bacterium]
MGWPFDEASWNAASGAYYSAVGSELLWVGVSVVICIASMVVGALHENDAYRKAEN